MVLGVHEGVMGASDAYHPPIAWGRCALKVQFSSASMSLEVLNGVSFKSLAFSLAAIFIVSRVFKFAKDLKVRQRHFPVRRTFLMTVI